MPPDYKEIFNSFTKTGNDIYSYYLLQNEALIDSSLVIT